MLEWGTRLDPDKFSLLRDHLHWFVERYQQRPAGSDIVDALTLDQAADVLEWAVGDPPIRKLLDGSAMICASCNGKIDEPERVRRSGWCAGCRSYDGRVIELDLAIKTGRARGYDQCRNDPLEKGFSEWREISTFICDKHCVARVSEDDWNRFRRWFMCARHLSMSEFLHLKRTELVIILRDLNENSIERSDQAITQPIQDRRLILGGFGDQPLVDGTFLEELTRAQYDTIEALLDAGERGLTKDQLVRRSGHSDAVGVISRLLKKVPQWIKVIRMAGKSGGRYRISI